jgi:pilus assembly protein Flp/PilA
MLRDARNLVCSFAADESGTTAIEYSIIAGGIAAAIIGVISAVGTNLQTLFYDKITNAFATLP